MPLESVPDEVVTVGDCELDDNLRELLAAAREATVNSAKWSGADVVSVFAEIEPRDVSVFVRDRGNGFDPDAVPSDRKGVSARPRVRSEPVPRAAAALASPSGNACPTTTLS